MKKFLKWAGIITVALIAIMMVYAVFGKEATLALDIAAVDLEQIPDGSYTGKYDCYRWSNTAEVTVKAHRITAIQPLKLQDGRDDLVEELTQRILHEQRTDVDAVSGATASSNGFLKAVEVALKSAPVKP